MDLPYDGMTGRLDPAARRPLQLVPAGLAGAWLGLRGQARRLDGALFHTQVTSLFSAGLMRRVPSVISLDATPLQYDALGAFYGHAPSGNARLEALKKRLNQRAFGAARHLVTWSQWAKDSLVADYGVPPEKITVIPPGIDTARWDFDRSASRPTARSTCCSSAATSRARAATRCWKRSPRLPPSAGRPSARRHQDAKGWGRVCRVSPSSRMSRPTRSRLLRLFAQADLFVFPTRGDCLPLAVMEALASGLPVVTTTVGALPEAVTHGETGWIVPPDDAGALAEALATLAGDGALRARLAAQARAVGAGAL